MSKSFILYGIANCSYCLKSKQLLDDMNIPYQFYQIQTEDKSLFLDKMSEKTDNQRTFPLIFYGSDFIGGFTELEDYVAFLN